MDNLPTDIQIFKAVCFEACGTLGDLYVGLFWSWSLHSKLTDVISSDWNLVLELVHSHLDLKSQLHLVSMYKDWS